MPSDNFYVYEHWRPDKDECFYVGKGCGNRSSLRHRRNKHHVAIVRSLRNGGMEPEIRFVAEDLAETAAFELECARIAYWRQRGVKLANVTSGGDGVRDPSDVVRLKMGNGQRGKKRPAEHCAKLSEAHRLRMQDPEARILSRNRPETVANNPILQKGHTVSDETKRRLSQAHLGRQLTQEHRSAISVGNTGRKISEETRVVLSVAARNRFSDPLERQKVSERRKGMVFSDEHRLNLSLSHIGKSSPKPPPSVATRKKISLTLKGRQRSPEAIAKQRETLARKREDAGAVD